MDYQWALRSAYCMADVCTDHAAKQVRMHGYPGGAYAIPMNRVVGMLMAYFETADPYLLNIGEAVVDNSWRTHLNSWPRLAIGRDACFLRGAVFLYRYNNDDHYRRIAAAGCRHVTQVQRANGTFGDQGGGTGIHQWAAYITKPWMACLGTSAVLDYLMLDPETPHLTACIHKLGDWLLANRWERNGIYSWSYQHDFDGGKVWFDLTHNRPNPLPSEGQWHDDHLARILGYCAWTKGDPTYLDAFLRSLETMKDAGGGHSFAATSVFLLWLQSYLWQAQLTPEGIVTTPLYGGPRCPATAEVITPTGLQPVTCPAPQA
jgi:hypothetical protein